MDALKITVLTVPGCPHAPVALERIAAALEGRPADVELVEVTDEPEAVRLGMTGSPTILVGDVDPFAVPGTPAGMACRLYRDEAGRVEGAPGVEDLRTVLSGEAGRMPRGAA
ncbi:thioredoxin family protein [Streptomyces sp. NPDC048659]|uniref:thioredoxin family protein n=1 Tax=Streptomyces sp. NPDC048659 TaxID=3155489 RepID=UPI00341FCFBB